MDMASAKWAREMTVKEVKIHIVMAFVLIGVFSVRLLPNHHILRLNI